jgi:nitrite reductase (NADH) large subunit
MPFEDMTDRPRVLIVGGGIAGQAVCEQLAPRAQVTLACGEPRLPYDRVSLGRLLAGETPDALQLRPEDWYSDRGVDVRLGTWIAALEPDAGTALTADEELLHYDRVVLCTGSDALVPPMEGADSPGVCVFRGPEDCERIVEAAAGSRRAAVIGGGLLGLEAAYQLATMGVPVSVVHLMGRLMER